MDIIEIHDDGINVSEIMNQIQKRIEVRQKDGVYSQEVEELLEEDLSRVEKEPKIFISSFEELNYALHQVNNCWQITGRYPILSKQRVIAPLVVFGKRIVRFLVRTYVDVIMQQQNKFNSYVVRSLNALGTIAEKQSDYYFLPDFDYYSFEERHRKDEGVKRSQSCFLSYFNDCKNVLDIGCGRGVFLEFLKEHGITAYGIDIDEDMVLHCQKKGLNAKQGEVLYHLECLNKNSLDGVFAGQIAEHFTPGDLIQFIRLAYQKLQPGSYFVAETLNPYCLAVLSQFLVDPSHIRPVHPEFMRFMLESAGFRSVEFKYFSPYSEEVRLQSLPLEETLSESESLRWQVLNENLRKLNDIIYGYQDYAVIARK